MENYDVEIMNPKVEENDIFYLELTIREENDELAIIKMKVCRKILILKCQYFRILLTSFSMANSKIVEITIPNAYALYDLLSSLHGQVINIKGIPEWQHICENYFCCDFIGAEFNMTRLEMIKVPSEGFELLLKVIKKIGYNDQTIQILDNNIPDNFDKSTLPKKLIKVITDREHDFVFTGQKNIFVVDNVSKQLRKITDYPFGNIGQSCVAPNGKNICVTSKNNIYILEIKSGKLVHTLIGHDSFIASVCYSPDSQKIVSGDGSSAINIWDANNGRLIHTIFNKHAINLVCYSPNNKMFASVGKYHDSTFKIWDAENYNLITKIKYMSPNTVCFTHDCEKIIMGPYVSKNKNKIKILNIKNHKMQTLKGCTNNVDYLFTDEFRIISGDNNGTIQIWDVTTYQLLCSFVPEELYPQGAALVTNGKKIIILRDGRVKQWDMNLANSTDVATYSEWPRKIHIVKCNSKLLEIVKSIKQ